MLIFRGEWNNKVEQQAAFCIVQSYYTNFRNTLLRAEQPPRVNSLLYLGDLESRGFLRMEKKQEPFYILFGFFL